MSNILCKIGLHKWQKVESTEINILEIMKDILKFHNEYFIDCERSLCKKFGINRNYLWLGYDIYDEVCVKCGDCKYNIEKKRNELIEKRNQIVINERKIENKNRMVENIYKGCKK